jgi:hypothetical protein
MDEKCTFDVSEEEDEEDDGIRNEAPATSLSALDGINTKKYA